MRSIVIRTPYLLGFSRRIEFEVNIDRETRSNASMFKVFPYEQEGRTFLLQIHSISCQ